MGQGGSSLRGVVVRKWPIEEMTFELRAEGNEEARRRDLKGDWSGRREENVPEAKVNSAYARKR